jgi:transposase-like protein
MASTVPIPPIEDIVREFEEARTNRVSALAARLNISRQTLYTWVEAYYKQNPDKRPSIVTNRDLGDESQGAA